MERITGKERNEIEKKRSYEFMMRNYSREQRYLKVFARDFSAYLSSSDWLQNPDARRFQKFYDFLADFADLKEKMKEFRWSKEFLLENGIDFAAARKLYFSVA